MTLANRLPIAINPEQIAALIEQELKSVEASLTQAQESGKTVVLDQSAIGRVSRGDALMHQAMAINLHERLLVKKRKLEAAKNRLTSGVFGLCCGCQARIELTRLEADISTVFCLDCMLERDPLLRDK